MLGDKEKSILDDKPEILRKEASLTEPVKKKGGWLFKVILGLVILGLLYYLWIHPGIIMNPVNEFLGRFT